LASLSIQDTDARFPLGKTKVRGVGSWSPDNRYLFFGTRSNEFMANRLKVLDVADGRVIDLTRLGEGIDGSRCRWIHRVFLEEQPG